MDRFLQASVLTITHGTTHMQSYHIARNGQQVGVFPESEIEAGLASGQFFPSDLYWGDGMAEWQPVSSKFRSAAPVPAEPPSVAPLPAPEPAAVLNPYATPGSLIAKLSLAPEFKLASLGARLSASLLDSLVFFLALVPALIGAALMGEATGPDGNLEEFPAAAGGAILVTVILCIGLIIYNIILLSKHGQTLGKKWMHIRIVSYPAGENPGFVKAALVRGFVNGLIGQFVPFYAIVDACFIFREDRRCLHDLMAETTVIGGDPPDA